MEVRQVYRQLLKAVHKRIPLTEGQSWHSHVTKEFRQRPQGDMQSRLQLAKDYAFLINSVHEQKELLASYNIGVDRQARQREDIQRSAQRAGLQLPPAWDADQTQAGSQALHKNKPA